MNLKVGDKVKFSRDLIPENELRNWSGHFLDKYNNKIFIIKELLKDYSNLESKLYVINYETDKIFYINHLKTYCPFVCANKTKRYII